MKINLTAFTESSRKISSKFWSPHGMANKSLHQMTEGDFVSICGTEKARSYLFIFLISIELRNFIELIIEPLCAT